MECTKTRPNKNKNRRKRYLFRCFRPDDVVDPPRRKEKTTDPLLTYITFAEKEGIVLPTILSSAFTVAKGGSGDGSGSRRRKVSKDRSLRIRQALIAALNHTSLGKKIIKKRKINKNTNCYISRIKGEEGDNNIMLNKMPENTNSHTSTSHYSHASTIPSILSSSCSTSSLAAQASAPSSELLYSTKQKQDVGKGYFISKVSMCVVFLTSLLVLIFWGKLCAILCTSIGFFVVPLRRRRRSKEERVFEETNEVDSTTYKKFTMHIEGLLRRRKS